MDQIQFRRDTAARWDEVNPTLLSGEIGWVIDKPNQYKMGDGKNKWKDLPLRGFNGTIAPDLGNDENSVVSLKVVTEKLTELGYYEDSGIFRAYSDSNGNLLCWITDNGEINWAKGIPFPIKKELNVIHKDINDVNIENQNINNWRESINTNLLSNEDTIYAITDKGGNILFGINKDGEPIMKVPKSIKLYIDKNKGWEILATNVDSSLFKCSPNKCLGIASHLARNNGFSQSFEYPYRKEIVKGMAKLPINYVRFDTDIINSNNEEALKRMDNVLYLLKTNNFLPLPIISYDENSPEPLETKIESTKQYVTKIINRYKGKVKPSDANGEEFSFNVEYYEFLNEILSDDKLTIPNLALYTRSIYETIKKVDATKKFLMGSQLSPKSERFIQLLQYEYSDGTHFWNYIDGFNFHPYLSGISITDAFISFKKNCVLLSKIHNDNSILDKEVWVTEGGFSTYKYTEKLQAYNLVDWLLRVLACGIDKVFIYQFIDSTPSFISTKPSESYYGIVSNSLSNPYISLTSTNGSNISPGDGFKRCTITGSNTNIYLDSYAVNTIKREGLVVGGDFNLKKLDIKKSDSIVNLFTGDKVIQNTNTYTIDKSKFSSLVAGDLLAFTVTPPNASLWKSLNPKKSFYVLQYLYNKLFNMNSYPNIETLIKDKLNVAYWINNNKPIFVIWGTNVEISIKHNENGIIYNWDNSIIECPENIKLDNDIIYVENTDKIKIRIV